MHHTGTGQRKWRRGNQSRPVKPLQRVVTVRQIASAGLLFALPACRSNPEVALEPRAAPLGRTSLAPVLRPASLSFETLNLAADLSPSDIYSLAQDAQGFLWLATEDGVNRYDGYAFKVFRPQRNDATSLTDDDVTRAGAFEPVGTHPDHQRRGLGRALPADGMRRMRALGATPATVGSGATGPCAFYESLGMVVADRAEL